MNQQVKNDFPVTDQVRHAMQVSLRGCEELIPEDEWQQKLARAEATGVPLRIKLGLDPTAPDIHIGHRGVEQNAPVAGFGSSGDLPDW